MQGKARIAAAVTEEDRRVTDAKVSNLTAWRRYRVAQKQLVEQGSIRTKEQQVEDVVRALGRACDLGDAAPLEQVSLRAVLLRPAHRVRRAQTGTA